MEEDPEELLRRAQAGDTLAGSQLFTRYEAQILAIVRRRLGPGLRQHVESVDVAQSVIGDAVGGLPHFEARGEAALVRWLAGIVENKLRNLARKRDRQGPVTPIGPEDSSLSSPAALDPTAPFPAPPEEVERAESIDQVRRAVALLPEEWRQLVELRDYQRLSWAEVAHALDLTEKAAQSRHARARVRLASLLARPAPPPG
jgi:RNA polymerase sigma-70 factor (ECF subfamily)